MKQIFLLCCCVYIINVQAQSCCTSQLCTSNTGADALDDNHYLSRVGLSYSFMSDRFSLISKINESGSIEYHNQYHSLNLNARLAFSPRVYMSMQVPYKFILVNNQSKTTPYRGLSDIQVGLTGIVLSQVKKRINHQLELGLDAQLPTGRYFKANDLYSSSVVVSPGTGAYALTAKIAYKLRKGHFNYINQFAYKKSFVNSEKLLIGGHLSHDCRFAWISTAKKWMFVTAINTGFDIFGHNRLADKQVSLSSGVLFRAGLSAECKWKHYTAQVAWSMPFYQSLALSKYHINQLFALQFNYLFSIKSLKK